MILNLILTDAFVGLYCGGIFLFLLFFAGRLIREALPLSNMLQKWSGKMGKLGGEEGFAREFEQYNSGMSKDFGTPWNEFVETLVLPAPGSDDPIRNTHEVSRYLNGTSIIFPKVRLGVYRSVPNLLTGLGILGTFIGLAAGIGAASSGLASSDPAEITASLQRLLGGASLAFVTSIVGIMSSMAFVFVERRQSRKLHLAVDEWVESIESCLKRVTSEGVALDQLEQLKLVAGDLRRFNTDLIISLEKALDEGIAGRLSPQLESLLEAVEGLRTDRSSDAGKMIEQALGRFTDAMKESTGSQFEDMGSIVADLNRTLQDSSVRMEQSQDDIRTALDSVVSKLTTSMSDGASAMTDTLQQSLADVTSKLDDASQKMAEKMAHSSISAATELKDTVGSVTLELAEAGVVAASQITGSMQNLEAAAESLNRSTQQSERVLGDMTTFVDRINFPPRHDRSGAEADCGRRATDHGNSARHPRIDRQERRYAAAHGCNGGPYRHTRHVA